jgi:hypothetical protein
LRLKFDSILQNTRLGTLLTFFYSGLNSIRPEMELIFKKQFLTHVLAKEYFDFALTARTWMKCYFKLNKNHIVERLLQCSRDNVKLQMLDDFGLKIREDTGEHRLRRLHSGQNSIIYSQQINSSKAIKQLYTFLGSTLEQYQKT